jgi:hypothetical protein
MPDPAGKRASNEPELHSLREAAALAGVPRAYLDECIAAGRLAVHLHHSGKGVKFRVTRAGLEAAGILSPPPNDESIVQLLREQAERLAAVEEQRFQLAGQLGAALERNRALEERLQLAASVDLPSPMDLASTPTAASASGTPSREKDEANRVDGVKPAADEPSKQSGDVVARLRGIARLARRTVKR